MSTNTSTPSQDVTVAADQAEANLTGKLRVANDVVRVYTERYHDRLAKLVQGFRDLAENIERIGAQTDRNSVTGLPPFTSAAQRVLHEITWHTANMGIEYLVTEAGHTDHAEGEVRRLSQVHAMAAEIATAMRPNATPAGALWSGTTLGDEEDRDERVDPVEDETDG